jgi:hypothetical protein
MNSKNNFAHLNKIVSVSIIFLSSIGIIGNIISIVICMRKELRKVPTFIFMAFVSILNILKLITKAGCILSFQFLIIEFNFLNNIFFNPIIVLIFCQSHSTIYLMVCTIFLTNNFKSNKTVFFFIRSL